MTAPANACTQGEGVNVNSTGKHSYGQILKSSALIGGSSAFNIGLGIIRTKAIALMLGRAGVGLFGIYGQVNDLTRSIAGLGINTSGVRQIAEAVGSGDSQRIARTVITLRRVAFCSGALGALLLVAVCKPVSWLTFKDGRHAASIALLALAVFFGDVSQGQAALVQGMRRIADVARLGVFGALYGTLFSLPIIYFFRENGVVPVLVCVAAMNILSSWWYARQIRVERISITMAEMIQEVSALLKLGLVFMSTGLMPLGAFYLMNIMVLHQFGLEATGCLTAAYWLSGQYVNFITQAMGTDFLPRLTAIAANPRESNRLVNEQVEVGLLLAAPGVMATLTLAPLVIQCFYTAEFQPAVEILRWISLGMILRVASWPMAYILVARAEKKLYFLTEFLTNALLVILSWTGLQLFKLNGTGIAFFAIYVVYITGICLIVRRLTGFRWSSANLRLAALLTPAIVAVFVSWYFLPRVATVVFGLLLTGLTGFYSLKTLCALVPLERLPGPVRKIASILRLAAPVTKE